MALRSAAARAFAQALAAGRTQVAAGAQQTRAMGGGGAYLSVCGRGRKRRNDPERQWGLGKQHPGEPYAPDHTSAPRSRRNPSKRDTHTHTTTTTTSQATTATDPRPTR
jgi:hypothetical protein